MKNLKEFDFFDQGNKPFDGYSIALLPDSPILDWKCALQAEVPCEDRFEHPMISSIPHITLAYNVNPYDIFKIVKVLPLGVFSVELDGIVMLDVNSEYSAIAVKVSSPVISKIHREIQSQFLNKANMSPKFYPHITFDYIKKSKSHLYSDLLHEGNLKHYNLCGEWGLQGYIVFDRFGRPHPLHLNWLSDDILMFM